MEIEIQRNKDMQKRREKFEMNVNIMHRFRQRWR